MTWKLGAWMSLSTAQDSVKLSNNKQQLWLPATCYLRRYFGEGETRKINRMSCGICQEDALSPLLLYIGLNPLSHIITKSGYGYWLTKWSSH